MFNLNVNADSHADKLDRIESQVQDALIKINRMEKENKDVPSIKVGPGLKFKSGKNEVKLGGRIHFDAGSYKNEKGAKCEVNDTTGGSCLVNGTNFRRMRLAMSGKYDDFYYYKASVDWGASAKQGSDATDNASIDEVFLGYKLAKRSFTKIYRQLFSMMAVACGDLRNNSSKISKCCTFSNRLSSRTVKSSTNCRIFSRLLISFSI